MKMSIHRALAEIKLLDNKINRGVKDTFIGCKKKSADKVKNTALDKESFKTEVKSNYQSINDLIQRRILLKTLINKSNAETKVKINDKEMTVMEAIEYKNIIEYKKRLLESLNSQYRLILSNVQIANENVEENLNSQLEALNASDKNNKIENLTGFIETFRNQHEWEVVDGIQIEENIKTLQNEIEDFESNIDYVLSESNSITQIEIED